MPGSFTNLGYTVVELLISIVIAALLLAGLQNLLDTGMSAHSLADDRSELARQADFAMGRMVDAVRTGRALLIPLADDPYSSLLENIREQTVPASAPPEGSSLATAVLAVTISSAQDLDSDGIPDADDDRDGRIDEDLPGDIHNDGKAGIRDFDDDGDGVADHWLQSNQDDDESLIILANEDVVDGIDNDGDGGIDDDPPADNNGDSAPGVAGVDDDGDGSIDEGEVADDDEDGQSDEDWLNPVVFYLNGASLIERRAVPWDTNADSVVSGQDYVESTLADNVILLRFERVQLGDSGALLIGIALSVADSNGETFSLTTQVRVGAR